VDSDGTPVLLYTGVRLREVAEKMMTLPSPEHDLQLPFIESQLAAIAVDESLREWRKLEQPMIELPPAQSSMPLTGWRDPFIVKRLPSDNSWTMLIGSGIRGVGGAPLVYRSDSLLSGWQFEGVLCTGRPEWGDMWECPLLIELPLDCEDAGLATESGEPPHTHMLCVSPDAPTNPVYYFLGRYDGHRFDLDNAAGPMLLDLGNTVYAPNVTTGADGEQLLWGWIQETRPIGSTSHKYAGCMSLPRVLTRSPAGRLLQRPAAAVDKLRLGDDPAVAVTGAELLPDQPLPLRGVTGAALDIELVLDNTDATASGLQLESFASLDERATCKNTIAVLYDWERGRLEVLSEGRPRVGGPLSHDPRDPLRLRVLVDHSAVEVFASSGEVLTTRIYRGAVPSESTDAGLALVSACGTSRASARVWAMGSIWGEAELEHTNELLYGKPPLRAPSGRDLATAALAGGEAGMPAPCEVEAKAVSAGLHHRAASDEWEIGAAHGG